MIQIIKHGRYFDGECECKSCGCVFKYQSKDVYSKMYAYNLTEHQLINCPECKSVIDLHSYEFKKEMEKRLESEKDGNYKGVTASGGRSLVIVYNNKTGKVEYRGYMGEDNKESEKE